MAPLRVIPYKYVPTKRRPRNNDQRSTVDRHPGTHHITQQSKPSVLPEKPPQLRIVESSGDARGAGEKSKHDNVYEVIADEPARRRIQDPVSIPNTDVSLSGVIANQDTLGRETDYGEVEFTENNIVDIDPSCDFDSIFGDIDALFEEQEVSSEIERNGGHATNPYTDACAGQTDSLASEMEFAKTDMPSPCSSQLSKRRTRTKRRREKDNLSVFVNGSSSDSGTSDENDNESIFEVRRSKRSKPESPTSSPDSSIYSSDVEGGVAKTGKHLNTDHPVPVVDLIERENKNPAIGPGGTSNLIHDIDPQIDDGDLDSDGDDDELCRSPSWYRFGPSPAKSKSNDILQGSVRPCYVAQVEDAYHEREFHNIIGREYIDGEVHYLVDWVPTLVRGHVLRKAKAQPLISSFEARCQSYKKEGKGHGDGTQQRKRRGRPRNQV